MKYTKVCPLNKVNTYKILHVIIQQFLSEIGKLYSITTDHGTQFKENGETLLHLGIKTYKTSQFVTPEIIQ